MNEREVLWGESSNKNAALRRCHIEFIKWNAEYKGRGSEGALACLASLGAQELCQSDHLTCKAAKLGKWNRRIYVSLKITLTENE